ncbi:APO protein 3 [Hibiscus syriacus]|uniref:APO protein 3 n=1 Tax=Hibiscus syriacus TaxID=106335 RepID=A0A6A2YPZ9_HIBSY|nr:APO protein 3 [Hibiscus syriacus]
MRAGSTISNKIKEEAAAEEDENSIAEQEEALVALIEHRTKEVEQLGNRISYYKSQLDEAKKRLHDSQSKLALLRGRHNTTFTNASLASKSVKVDQRSTPECINGGSKMKPLSKTELVIPSVNPKISQPIKLPGSSAKTTISLEASPASNRAMNVRAEASHRTSSNPEVVETKDREGLKGKQKEHKELIPLVRNSSSLTKIGSYSSNHISSQHKRKLRSLAVCPVNDHLFVTSALDGIVHLWQIQARGSSASFLSSTDCVSAVERRWPEDIAWHPHGNSLFCAYTADAGDSQISVLNFNKTQLRGRLTYLVDKPHVKGIINSIIFMPWENTCFVTGGSDHAVVLWDERDENLWKPKSLHRNLHSSAVMGVAGMHQKQVILSAGADKRIIGFDVNVGRADFKHQIESKCMSVLPNPCDFNLFMVQTGAHEKQLRLYDIRLRHTELHSFGWKQESSDSQSALINQAWSPDGLYLSSGSADPVIHIFDIRYNARKPCQSIQAHQKRVFKAVWHYSLPLLISISSDLQIGLHKKYI